MIEIAYIEGVYKKNVNKKNEVNTIVLQFNHNKNNNTNVDLSIDTTERSCFCSIYDLSAYENV